MQRLDERAERIKSTVAAAPPQRRRGGGLPPFSGRAGGGGRGSQVKRRRCENLFLPPSASLHFFAEFFSEFPEGPAPFLGPILTPSSSRHLDSASQSGSLSFMDSEARHLGIRRHPSGETEGLLPREIDEAIWEKLGHGP